MKRNAFALLFACAVCGSAEAQTVSAEPWLRAGTWLVTAELGGAAFSDFQRAMAQPAGTMEMPRFERRVSAGTTSTLGGNVAYWITDGVAVRGGVAWAPSRFNVWNDGPGERALQQHGTGGEDPGAKLGIWLGNASLVFRLPVRLGRVVPYGIAGAGAVHYRITDSAELPPEARHRFADGHSTAIAAVFGLGTTLPLQRNNALLSFELTNHLVRTPLDDEGGGEWFEVSGVPLQLAYGADSGKDAIALTSNLRLTIGLTIPVRSRSTARDVSRAP